MKNNPAMQKFLDGETITLYEWVAKFHVRYPDQPPVPINRTFWLDTQHPRHDDKQRAAYQALGAEYELYPQMFSLFSIRPTGAIQQVKKGESNA